MKLELFSTVFLLTLPGNLLANRPDQEKTSGCQVRQVQQAVPETRDQRRSEGSRESFEDVLLPPGAKVL